MKKIIFYTFIIGFTLSGTVQADRPCMTDIQSFMHDFYKYVTGDTKLHQAKRATMQKVSWAAAGAVAIGTVTAGRGIYYFYFAKKKSEKSIHQVDMQLPQQEEEKQEESQENPLSSTDMVENKTDQKKGVLMNLRNQIQKSKKNLKKVIKKDKKNQSEALSDKNEEPNVTTVSSSNTLDNLQREKNVEGAGENDAYLPKEEGKKDRDFKEEDVFLDDYKIAKSGKILIFKSKSLSSLREALQKKNKEQMIKAIADNALESEKVGDIIWDVTTPEQLYYVVANCAQETTAKLLEYKKDGRSRLHALTQDDNDIFDMEMVKALVRVGADLHSRQEDSLQTPVMNALHKKNINLFVFLVEKGADLYDCAKNGKSVQKYATNAFNKQKQLLLQSVQPYEKQYPVAVQKITQWVSAKVKTNRNVTFAEGIEENEGKTKIVLERLEKEKQEN